MYTSRTEDRYSPLPEPLLSHSRRFIAALHLWKHSGLFYDLLCYKGRKVYSRQERQDWNVGILWCQENLAFRSLDSEEQGEQKVNLILTCCFDTIGWLDSFFTSPWNMCLIHKSLMLTIFFGWKDCWHHANLHVLFRVAVCQSITQKQQQNAFRGSWNPFSI